MPAHGDFVRRGWSDAAVAALDAWVSPALARCREGLGEETFADAMRAAPLWHGLLPAGLAGPEPLRLVMAPSVDRAGRLFPLLLGIEGEGDWADLAVAEALESALYAAIGGRADADGVLAMIPEAPGDVTGIGGWWMDRFDPAVPPDASARPDEALIERMLTASTQREAA